MSQANLYALGHDGVWYPVGISGTGTLQASGGGETQTANWSYAAAASGISNTSDVVLVAAAGVGNSNYLTDLSVINGSTGAATEVVIKDGSTVIWRQYFDPGAGISINFDNPLFSSPNTALNAAAITTSGKVYINACGYQDGSPQTLLAQGSARDELTDDLGAFILDDNSAIIYVQ